MSGKPCCRSVAGLACGFLYVWLFGAKMCSADRQLPLNVVAWNPCSTVAPSRRISQNFTDVSIGILRGTRGQMRYEDHIQFEDTSHHDVLHKVDKPDRLLKLHKQRDEPSKWRKAARTEDTDLASAVEELATISKQLYRWRREQEHLVEQLEEATRQKKKHKRGVRSLSYEELRRYWRIPKIEDGSSIQRLRHLQKMVRDQHGHRQKISSVVGKWYFEDEATINEAGQFKEYANDGLWCWSRFVVRQGAITHAETSYFSRVCYTDRSPWPYELTQMRETECPICAAPFGSEDEPRWHLRSHLSTPAPSISFSWRMEVSAGTPQRLGAGPSDLLGQPGDRGGRAGENEVAGVQVPAYHLADLDLGLG